jgi:putative DNA primase/helicase
MDETDRHTGELFSFYRAVLPEDGRFCLFLLPEARHEWVNSIDQLVNLTEKFQDRTGVYFGTAAFQTTDNRKQANVLALRSLRLDIDAGPDKLAKHGIDEVYATQRDALQDSVRFFKATGLAPSYIVSSGAGLHIYFCLDQDVTPEQWLPMAKALSFRGVQNDFKIDVSVTEDTARILRPVGAIHHFGSAGSADEGDVRVKVIKATGKVYSYDELASLLGAVAPARQYDMSINADVLFDEHAPTASAFKIAEHCGALRQVANTGGDVPEPYWRAMLGLVKHTVEADDAAHEWSQGYDGYDPEATARKLAGWATGPTTCAEFAKHTKACAACTFQGKIKSPIMLGRDLTPSTPDGFVKPSRAILQATLADWYVTKDGIKIKPQGTTTNVAALLQLHGWTARLNVMTKRTETLMPGNRTARDDHENAALAFFGDAAIRAGMARDGLQELLDAVAGGNSYHPVQEWIETTPWDGISRAALFHESLELTNDIHAAMRDKLMDAWALQAIGAIYEPDGIAAQGVLVLAGGQDIFKTRWAKALCPVTGAIREGVHLNPLEKDSVLHATNGWIVELGELDSTTRRSDISALKAFITSSEDIIRPPYARKENIYRRHTVYIGTVNGTGFLADDTGDRRFWVIAVKQCHMLPADTMQQIWAEYQARYQAGDRWHLDSSTKALLAESNADHRVIDPIRERILTRFDWAAVDWTALAGDEWRSHPKTQWMTATDICLRIGLDRVTRVEATRAGSIISELNKATFRKSNGIKLLAVPPINCGGL